MKRCFTHSLITTTLLLNAVIAFAATNQPAEDKTATVAHVINFVAKSDCTFIRNGRSYTPREASAHMKDKSEHYKKKIKTPEDFIRLAATKSLLSGKAYVVKTKDGKEIECAKWLTMELAKYRTSQEKSKKGKR